MNTQINHYNVHRCMGMGSCLYFQMITISYFDCNFFLLIKTKINIKLAIDRYCYPYMISNIVFDSGTFHAYYFLKDKHVYIMYIIIWFILFIDWTLFRMQQMVISCICASCRWCMLMKQILELATVPVLQFQGKCLDIWNALALIAIIPKLRQR